MLERLNTGCFIMGTLKDTIEAARKDSHFKLFIESVGSPAQVEFGELSPVPTPDFLNYRNSLQSWLDDNEVAEGYVGDILFPLNCIMRLSIRWNYAQKGAHCWTLGLDESYTILNCWLLFLHSLYKDFYMDGNGAGREIRVDEPGFHHFLKAMLQKIFDCNHVDPDVWISQRRNPSAHGGGPTTVASDKNYNLTFRQTNANDISEPLIEVFNRCRKAVFLLYLLFSKDAAVTAVLT